MLTALLKIKISKKTFLGALWIIFLQFDNSSTHSADIKNNTVKRIPVKVQFAIMRCNNTETTHGEYESS